MKIITLTFNNNRDWHFLLDLLNRLKLSFEWREEKPVKPNDESDDDLISELAGSWESNLTPDEMVDSIYSARR
jgi:hypothetical protein